MSRDDSGMSKPPPTLQLHLPPPSLLSDHMGLLSISTSGLCMHCSSDRVAFPTHAHYLDNSCYLFRCKETKTQTQLAHIMMNTLKTQSQGCSMLTYTVKEANRNPDSFHLPALLLVSGLCPQASSTQRQT